MEGFIRHIKKFIIKGKIHGIKIARILKITHLLFVGDVVIYGRWAVEEWVSYKELLEFFCSASRIVASESKSLFLEYGLDASIKYQIQEMFPFQFKDVESRFKYFSFFFKPNNYQ